MHYAICALVETDSYEMRLCNKDVQQGCPISLSVSSGILRANGGFLSETVLHEFGLRGEKVYFSDSLL